MRHKPIPLRSKNIHSCVLPVIDECGEQLVSLSSSTNIPVYPYYYHEGLAGAQKDCFVRVSVAERLTQVALELPAEYSLVVLDGWRPFAVQQTLYDQFKRNLLAQGWAEEAALYDELHKYVALPSINSERPARHLTGGAVDVTIAGPSGWLEMGTPFDDFSPRAQTRYFEETYTESADELSQQAKENRRILYHLMTKAGFTNYTEEWWHFDFGNQAWAIEKQTAAIYGGVLSL